jgi:hypothetical protein
MSKVLLLKKSDIPQKPYLCAYNPNMSLIGKTVNIRRCNARTHYTEDGKCICHLLGQFVKIVSERIHYDGSRSFEIIINGRSFFLERGEFLQIMQLTLLNAKGVAIIS